ncbi:MAG: hypothetical protein AAF962_01010 [Actinomycetota bacterium]
MGPVSFERLPGGDTRAEALSVAATLDQAGIRVLSIDERPPPDGRSDGVTGTRFGVVVRSADVERARSLLDADVP